VPAEPAYAIPVADPPRAKAAATRPPAAKLPTPQAPPPTPAIPTRGSISNKAPSRAIHVGPGAGPVDSRGRAEALPPLAPAWDEPPKSGGISPVLYFFVAAVVTGLAYLVLKNFLLPES